MVFGKYINRYYLKYAWMLILGIVALVLVDYFQLEVPKIYRLVIDGMNEGVVTVNGVEYVFNMDFVLDQICLPLFVVICVMVTGRFLWRVCFFGAGNKVEADLRARMFDHARFLSQEYYQLNKVGNLMSLFTNDLDTVNECFGWGVMMFCDALFLGVLSAGNMFAMNQTLAIFSLIPMALLLACSLLAYRVMEKKWEERQQAFSDLSDFAQESFSGIAVIKAFVKEVKELVAFRILNRKNEVVNVEFTKISTLMTILVTLFVESIICVILGYGGYLVYTGTFRAAELMEYIGYFTSITWPIMAVSELIGMMSRGKASLNRIGELLDAKTDVVDRPDAKEVELKTGKIEFKNLTFRYPDGEFDILENVSFTIEAGENVGLVGKTGAGKTTIVDLILRTYNVPDGTIFVDGYDVNEITMHSVRQASAYVPQDNFLFSDTIENNICFASDERSLELATAAAKLADIDSNITEFKAGYQTVLGERGVTVSGGQKQRISIARALMKNAPILILDDSVSAVDTNTERTILQNLKETRQGKTTILIAHRISTIEKMDKIIFVDDGKIVAVGKHAELYANCTDYKKMVDLQKLEDEGGNS